MREDSTQQSVLFEGWFRKPLVARFDQPLGSSDGGAVLLRGADEQLGLTTSMASVLRDRRDPERVQHSFHDVLRQRVVGIACGYEDGNDAARLRRDPIQKLVLDRDPQRGLDLASQPTLSRFENGVTRREVFAMGAALAERVIERHRARRRGRAKRITVDVVEVQHADYPGERLIACRNPVLGRKRAHKRDELLTATLQDLEKIQARVWNGRLSGRDKIGLKVGEKLGRHNMSKHIRVTITNDDLAFEIDQDSVTREAAMDGIYVIRTSVDRDTLTAADAVRAYKSLADAERAFKTMKSIDLHVRPIHHRLADRVKAHFFLCMLAYYVRWHMERAWASLTFKDDDTSHKRDRDPVTPAERSQTATDKAQTGTLPDGTTVHTFKTLLSDLATITRNTCRHDDTGVTFPMTTRPTPQQQKALNLLDTITL